jgi:hypothetical protein
LGQLGRRRHKSREALDPAIPALFIRPRPITERALYVVSVLVMFFFDIGIFFYAELSPFYLVPLTILIVWMLTSARNLGKNRSREKLESAYKIIMTGVSFYWLLVAIFVWIK